MLFYHLIVDIVSIKKKSITKCNNRYFRRVHPEKNKNQLIGFGRRAFGFRKSTTDTKKKPSGRKSPPSGRKSPPYLDEGTFKRTQQSSNGSVNSNKPNLCLQNGKIEFIDKDKPGNREKPTPNKAKRKINSKNKQIGKSKRDSPETPRRSVKKSGVVLLPQRGGAKKITQNKSVDEPDNKRVVRTTPEKQLPIILPPKDYNKEKVSFQKTAYLKKLMHVPKGELSVLTKH